MNILHGLETLLGMHQGGNPQPQATRNLQGSSPQLQGGQFNPGFTPLQNSGQGGPGYAANLQPTAQGPLQGFSARPQPQMIQPQPRPVPMNPQFTRPQVNTIGQSQQLDAQQFPNINQGGRFNPGYIPLQGSNLNFRQAPQPASFTPIQGNQMSPQQGIQLY